MNSLIYAYDPSMENLEELHNVFLAISEKFNYLLVGKCDGVNNEVYILNIYS